MTIILAIDTATGPCSAAIWYDGRISAYIEELRPHSQSARLLPMIEQALAQSGLTYKDLTAVACTTGPGSFTGIRVALAAAQGICTAAGIEGRGYTTLDVLESAARPHAAAGQRILSVLNAGKGEVYYQLDGNPPCIGTLETAVAAAGPNALVSGNIVIPELATAPATFPRADALAALAASEAGKTTHPLRPFYIRLPDAKLPSS